MQFPSISQDSIDALIARQLPAWLLASSSDQLQALHDSLLTQQRAQHALALRLGTLVPIDQFAEPLLVRALENRTGLTLDVRRAQFFSQWRRLRASVPASLPLKYEVHQHTQSLLASALHNFEEGEACAGAFSEGTRLTSPSGQVIELAPADFAALCRQLDVGKAYQDYLKQRFTPSDPAGSPSGQAVGEVNELLQAQLRSSLETALRLAQVKNEIDDATCRRLLSFTVPAPTASPGVRQLYLLGHKLHGVAAFAGALVVAWIPDDPQGPILSAASWEALYTIIGQRLRDPTYARFFQRFIAERERAAFCATLAERLVADRDAPALRLDGRALAIEEELFAYLRRVQVDKLFDDARILAVPTDEEDRQARSQRLQGLLTAGLDLLGVASLFVPVLGEVMLGIAALQITHEVYEGYEAWQVGDREAALGHLFAVVGGLAVGVLVGGAATATAGVLKRVAFVDALCPVMTETAGMRLCEASLADYREMAADHVIGDLVGDGSRRTLRLPHGRYQVSRHHATGTWRITHPRRAQATALRLEGNGTGGWWHALESPQHLQGAGVLFRRLSLELSDASDQEAVATLQATGFDEAHLRQLLLEQAQPPARLLDSLERQRLHERWPDLAPEAVERGLAQDLLPLVGESLLRRDFPGLSRRAANELLKRATGVQLRALNTSRKVPLAMAEQARWQLRDSRLDRACEGLARGRTLNRDSERLTLALIDHLAPWGPDLRVELRQGATDGPLLARAGAASAPQARWVIKQANGYLASDSRGQGLAGALPGDSLSQALAWHLAPAQKRQLGNADLTASWLDAHLASCVAELRDRAAGWIGQARVGSGVRPPVSWGDGRVGYPLSGRPGSSRQALVQGIRQVFPTLDDAQVQHYIDQRIVAGDNLWSHVDHLHQQLQSLQSSLAGWQRQAADVAKLAARSRVSGQILRCWRRQTLPGTFGYRLLLEGEQLDELPALAQTVDFSHVHHLALRNLGLPEVNDAFLRRFSGARRLHLNGNRLVTLPGPIAGMPELVELDLSDNLVRLDSQAQRTLARLRCLEVCNLDRNPLGQPPELGKLVRLRQVHLRATGMTAVPQGLLRLSGLEYADLRDNRIVTLAPVLFEGSARRMDVVALHDNPLSRASLAQLERFEQAGQSSLRRLRRHFQGSGSARDAWLTGLDHDTRALRQAQWDALRQQPGSDDLLRLLNDLRDTSDYRSRRQDLQARVWEVVEACEQDGQLREELFELAAQPRSCSDSVALGFSHLEVRALVHQRTAGRSGSRAERSLLQLGRELFRLEEVERLAALDIQARTEAGEMFDEVEVRLAYRVGLGQSLELPGQPRGMRYTNSAQVTERQLAQVREQVLGAESASKLVEAMCGRAFWRKHLRDTCPARFEAVDQPFHQRLEALADAAEDMSENDYLEAIGKVATARDAAQRDLIDQLTAEAWQRFQG